LLPEMAWLGIGHAGGRQYYVLSLHRDTPLDQQAAPSGEPPEAPAGGGQRVSNAFDDGFAGFTLKGALAYESCHQGGPWRWADELSLACQRIFHWPSATLKCWCWCCLFSLQIDNAR